jgi:hypothetical protein
MILYSNSCSFGAANQGHKIYPELVAKHCNATLINRGLPGSCNRRIIRTTVRDLLDLTKEQNKELICLIGLTFISRTELWQPSIAAKDNDGNFHSITVDAKKHNWSLGLTNTYVKNIHLSVSTEVQEYYKQWLLHMNKEAIITDLITDIILLKNFCQQHNIKLLLWSNAQRWPNTPEVTTNDIFLKTFVDTIVEYKNIINPWEFCFLDYALSLGYRPKDENIYGATGHPNETAHQDFSDYLIKHITALK